MFMFKDGVFYRLSDMAIFFIIVLFILQYGFVERYNLYLWFFNLIILSSCNIRQGRPQSTVGSYLQVLLFGEFVWGSDTWHISHHFQAACMDWFPVGTFVPPNTKAWNTGSWKNRALHMKSQVWTHFRISSHWPSSRSCRQQIP